MGDSVVGVEVDMGRQHTARHFNSLNTLQRMTWHAVDMGIQHVYLLSPTKCILSSSSGYADKGTLIRVDTSVRVSFLGCM